jgi:signal transduction histidine kinase
VREEATRVNRIVGDLIEFARPGTPLAKYDLHLTPIARDAVANASMIARAHGVRIELDSTESAHAHVDEHLFRQALINLITNAVHASKDGGTVAVRLRTDDRAIIRVSNFGTTIREEDLERIFEPFFTTKASGTGLGLAVVKRFADVHDGEIDVSSSPEHGTVFIIRWG